MEIKICPNNLSKLELKYIHNLLIEAFEQDFSAEDWQHTFGGTRVIGLIENKVVAHAALVPRRIWLDDIAHQVGYLEGVAVLPKFQKQGFGSELLASVSNFASKNYQWSMLSSSEKHFYRKQGWQDFLGQSFVLINDTAIATQTENDGLMCLAMGKHQIPSPMRAVCEPRSGDYW